MVCFGRVLATPIVLWLHTRMQRLLVVTKPVIRIVKRAIQRRPQAGRRAQWRGRSPADPRTGRLSLTSTGSLEARLGAGCQIRRGPPDCR